MLFLRCTSFSSPPSSIPPIFPFIQSFSRESNKDGAIKKRGCTDRKREKIRRGKRCCCRFCAITATFPLTVPFSLLHFISIFQLLKRNIELMRDRSVSLSFTSCLMINSMLISVSYRNSKISFNLFVLDCRCITASLKF